MATSMKYTHTVLPQLELACSTDVILVVISLILECSVIESMLY